MNLFFREARINDIFVIRGLAEKIWREHYAAIISAQQIEYMLKFMYSEESLKRQMSEGQPFTLILNGEKAIGYYSVSEKEQGIFFLHKFYLQSADQRKGNGSAAFKHLLRTISSPSLLRLQVNRRNVNAINFYFKHGFTITYAKDFDIGEGFSMDDFVMERRVD